MPASGELIRLMNYVDDISATVRRINASAPMVTNDEMKRLAEYMRTAQGKIEELINRLNAGCK